MMLQKLHSKRLEEAYRVNSTDIQLEHIIPEKLINQHSRHTEHLHSDQTQTSSSNFGLNEIKPYFTTPVAQLNPYLNPHSNTPFKSPVANLLVQEKCRELLNHDSRFVNFDLNMFPVAQKPAEVDFVLNATNKNEDEIILDLVLSQEEPQKLENAKLKSVNGPLNKVKSSQIENDDVEECKLIEDLFFLK